jgi:tetratricopeptide (TPR) repeat protein
LADLGRYSEALGLVRAVPVDPRRTRPLDLRLWYVTGDILARSGRSAEALEQFRKILRHDPAAFDTAERVAALE